MLFPSLRSVVDLLGSVLVPRPASVVRLGGSMLGPCLGAVVRLVGVVVGPRHAAVDRLGGVVVGPRHAAVDRLGGVVVGPRHAAVDRLGGVVAGPRHAAVDRLLAGSRRDLEFPFADALLPFGLHVICVPRDQRLARPLLVVGLDVPLGEIVLIDAVDPGHDGGSIVVVWRGDFDADEIGLTGVVLYARLGAHAFGPLV